LFQHICRTHAAAVTRNTHDSQTVAATHDAHHAHQQRTTRTTGMTDTAQARTKLPVEAPAEAMEENDLSTGLSLFADRWDAQEPVCWSQWASIGGTMEVSAVGMTTEGVVQCV
jgi:hypothetical protein